jgi:hypothetical protein
MARDPTNQRAHLHHNGVIHEEREYVHEHYVVGGRKAEQQTKSVKRAISQPIDVEGDGNDNCTDDKSIPDSRVFNGNILWYKRVKTYCQIKSNP